MTLHLLKLCVGCESIADLESWIDETRLLFQRLGRPYRQTHTTRMVPKRMDEILDGGSLYWVIKGRITARQRIEAIEPFTAEDGIQRCHLVLEPVVVPVQSRPCRPFQGWRYLPPGDAPVDIRAEAVPESMPQAMRDDLRALGLL
ncbi:MAG: DUF1489 domain-containing protein [Beijerinckiaceae bacterium]|nr:DUF1489 domain-containing protein [Beijerinckiaceae bacterium]